MLQLVIVLASALCLFGMAIAAMAILRSKKMGKMGRAGKAAQRLNSFGLYFGLMSVAMLIGILLIRI